MQQSAPSAKSKVNLCGSNIMVNWLYTTQKKKSSIKDFFSKCDQI